MPPGRNSAAKTALHLNPHLNANYRPAHPKSNSTAPTGAKERPSLRKTSPLPRSFYIMLLLKPRNSFYILH